MNSFYLIYIYIGKKNIFYLFQVKLIELLGPLMYSLKKKKKCFAHNIFK